MNEFWREIEGSSIAILPIAVACRRFAFSGAIAPSHIRVHFGNVNTQIITTFNVQSLIFHNMLVRSGSKDHVIGAYLASQGPCINSVVHHTVLTWGELTGISIL